MKPTKDSLRDWLNSQNSNYDFKPGNVIDEFCLDSMLESVKRPMQLLETIQNNYSVYDYDRWQHIQDLLFPNSDHTIQYTTAMEIVRVLYENEDIDILNLKE